MTAADEDDPPAELGKQAKPTPALIGSRGVELHNCPAETDSRGRAEQLPISFKLSEVARCTDSYRRGWLQNGLWPNSQWKQQQKPKQTIKQRQW